MIYILDRDENIIGHLTNDTPNGTPFFDDVHSLKIADNNEKQWSETFSVKVPSQFPEAELLEFGNHLLIEAKDGRYKLFTIDEVSEEINGETHLKTVDVAYNTFMVDMRNYNYIFEEKTFTPANTANIIRYLLANVGWDYGELMELYVGGSKSFTISEGTALSNLDAFVKEFNLEVEAFVEVVGTKIVGKHVRFSKTDMNQDYVARFEYRRDLISAKRQKTSNDFATMLYAYTMPDKDGKRKSIKSVNEIKNPFTGQTEKLPYIYDSDANDKWNDGKQFIVQVIKSETLGTPQATLAWAKEQLAYYNHPKFTYTIDVDIFEDTPQIGEKVLVVDMEMSPSLAVEAFVIGTENSKADPQNDKIILGEFKEIEIKNYASISAIQNELALLNKKSRTYTIDEYTTDIGQYVKLMVVVREDGVKMTLANENYTWRRTSMETMELDELWTMDGTTIEISQADYEIYYYECVVLIDLIDYQYILRNDFNAAMNQYIKKVGKYIKEDNVVIGMITDTHYDTYSVVEDKRETKLRALEYTNNLVEASNQISMDAVVHCGDLMDGRKANQNIAQIELDSAIGVFRNAKAPRIIVRGNHDTNYLFYRDGGKYADRFKASGPIPNADSKSIFSQFWEEDNVIGGNGIYGAYKIPNKNLAIIFLDCHDLNEKLVSGDRVYIAGQTEAYSYTQIKWLADFLADLEAGTDIIVFSHVSLTRGNAAVTEIINKQQVLDVLNGWRTGGTKTISSSRTDYSFSFTKTFPSPTGKIIALVGGHSHIDTAERDVLMGGQVPSFIRTCGYQGGKSNRPLDTVNETAFDTIIINQDKTTIRFLRFGYGDDKFVNYTLTTDITTGNDPDDDFNEDD